MICERDIVINKLFSYIRSNDSIDIGDKKYIIDICQDLEDEDVQLDFENIYDSALYWILRVFSDTEYYQWILTKIRQEYETRHLLGCAKTELFSD